MTREVLNLKYPYMEVLSNKDLLSLSMASFQLNIDHEMVDDITNYLKTLKEL